MNKSTEKYGMPVPETDPVYEKVRKEAKAERNATLKILSLFMVIMGVLTIIIAAMAISAVLAFITGAVTVILALLLIRTAVNNHPSVWLAEVTETDVLPEEVLVPGDTSHYLTLTSGSRSSTLLNIRMPNGEDYYINPGDCYVEEGDRVYFYEFPGSRVCGLVSEKEAS